MGEGYSETGRSCAVTDKISSRRLPLVEGEGETQKQLEVALVRTRYHLRLIWGITQT